MKYLKLFKCGQWWLVENDDESKLIHNLGKCESWAQHVVDALNYKVAMIELARSAEWKDAVMKTPQLEHKLSELMK